MTVDGAAAGAGDGGHAVVVCGIDGTREGFEAARQAARMAGPDGHLVLVAVAGLYAALAGRWGSEAPRWRMTSDAERTVEQCFDDLRARARASLAEASRQTEGVAGRVSTRVVDGDPDERLLEAAAAEGASLVVVGTHGRGRLTGAAIGATTSMVIHESPVSVLVARPPIDPAGFPARIVVGLDGSDGSRAAVAEAARLRDARGGRLVAVAASHAAGAAADDLAAVDGPVEVRTTPERPVDALVEASQTADLLVVGSRGLHGARALGSVSERVAHRAPSSVLVVRPGPAG